MTSWLFDNLRISFYWRDLIKDDLIADFKRWASTDDDSQAPDFILLGRFLGIFNKAPWAPSEFRVSKILDVSL